MKKTISLILAAVMLLTMLTACGGKAPAEPAETALYGKVTMENAPANALGAVVYLGYYESADAMKAEGWTFASHTWGHKNMSTVSMERLETDTQNFKENIDPLIGGTDIIIFAFGADINNGGEYTGNEKFEYLKSQGYDYYCNVDSNKYFVQMTDEYFRMGRRNVDGYRMYYNPDMLADLFDVSQVFDPSRHTPVPPMNGG